MIRLVKGNLLDAQVEALVNTVNTVGVMGKGIALMFKENFPDNTSVYEAACKAGSVHVGTMLVTRRKDLIGPKWIINFPTKKHWRQPSKLEWITEGLKDLRGIIVENEIQSIALPPLGSGNGGLDWSVVREKIIEALAGLDDVSILIFEPIDKYQNVMKREGVEKLTPARALVAELVRQYWILGFECTILEIQKLAYLLEANIKRFSETNPLDLKFDANRYGPYAPRLTHLLNALDGSYLHCDKRIADAGPLDVVWFDDAKRDKVVSYLTAPESKVFQRALVETTNLIDGFESPLGMELLATVHWLLTHSGVAASREAVVDKLRSWPGGNGSAARKLRLFDERLIDLALVRLASAQGAMDV